MRINNLKRYVLMLSLSLVMGSSAKGQGMLMDFVYGGVSDAEQILQAYLEPYANILGADLNAGWYNTARPHQLAGIDLTVNISIARAPSSILNFDLSTLDLNGQLVGSSSLTPTVAGTMDERPSLSYSKTIDMGDGISRDVEYARFQMPNGTGVDFFPLPMLQLAIGLPLGTDVSVRFLPQININERGDISMWGVGGRHSISQWIPGIKKMRFLDIAVQGGYTKVDARVNLDVEPLPEYTEVDPDPNFNWGADQYITQVMRGWTTNLITSQTISVLTLYQGIGYASSIVGMGLQGHYPVHTVIEEMGPNLGKLTYINKKDPVNLEFQNVNNLRYNLGARLKFGGFTLHYDFTYTLYATHSAGIGVSFR